MRGRGRESEREKERGGREAETAGNAGEKARERKRDRQAGRQTDKKTENTHTMADIPVRKKSASRSVQGGLMEQSPLQSNWYSCC